MPTLNEYFERVVVINLPDRRDRRREMAQELRRSAIQAEFVPGVRAAKQDDWPSLGARGCFQSHLAVLKAASETGAGNVLVLEDDLDFCPDFRARESQLLAELGRAGSPDSPKQWGFLYLGHTLPSQAAPASSVQLLPWTGEIRTTHFYAVNGWVLKRLVAYLEQVMSRPEGHPLGGPQDVDGALSMFRAQNPDVRTLIASPVLGHQRSSRSDITRPWHDRFPVIAQTAIVARRLARTIRLGMLYAKSARGS